MKLATGILILGMGLGTAVAQNPSILDNTKAKLNAVQQQKTADTNAALAASQGQKRKGSTRRRKTSCRQAGEHRSGSDGHASSGVQAASRDCRSGERNQGGLQNGGTERQN